MLKITKHARKRAHERLGRDLPDLAWSKILQAYEQGALKLIRKSGAGSVYEAIVVLPRGAEFTLWVTLVDGWVVTVLSPSGEQKDGEAYEACLAERLSRDLLDYETAALALREVLRAQGFEGGVFEALRHAADLLRE